MKGISPLIATVLLIAFTVAVFGIISIWGTTFTKTQTDIVSKQAKSDLTCVYGSISLSSMNYCNTYVWGNVKNTGSIVLGNVTLQIIYQNATQITIPLNDSNGLRLVLDVGQIASFNVSIGGTNYDRVWVYNNCSAKNDQVDRGKITAC